MVGVVEDVEDVAVRGCAEADMGAVSSGSLYHSIWEASRRLPSESRAQLDMVGESGSIFSSIALNRAHRDRELMGETKKFVHDKTLLMRRWSMSL